jgi:hypothetical protein
VAGAVQIVHGDMFGGPADLIVVPCSTGGRVTRFVRARMERFALPPVPAPIPLGEVRQLPLTGADHVAQFVAYAASVRDYASEPEAIERIGEKLGQATQQESVQVIHCPLLGAGAGTLSSETVFARLSQGFSQACADGSLLKIFVLDDNVYEKLVRYSIAVAQKSAGATLMPSQSLSANEELLTIGRIPPRVLISYTASGPGTRQWVDHLFRFLRAQGINARLDSYFLGPGMDVVQWMCNELDLADRVILVCDERYAARADRRHGGVGWETMIIQGDMYADMYRDRPEDAPAKYIPVVRSLDLDAALPTYLKTKLVLHSPPGQPEDEFQRRLVDEILRVRREIPPIVTAPTTIHGRDARRDGDPPY